MNSASPDTGARLLPPSYKCQRCSLEIPSSAFAPPVHGLITAAGGFFTQVGRWLMVDYDTKVMALIVTTVEKDGGGGFHLRVQNRTNLELTAAQLEKIRAAADAIWAMPGPLIPVMGLDRTWDIYLIDGKVIRREFGLGSPPAQGHDLENLLETIEQSQR